MNTNHQKLLDNRYTDAPIMRSNLLVASLQLMVWYFLHPTAWRHHLTRIAPDLPPDFNLTECNWRQPAVRHLLIIGYLIWPLLAGSIVLLILFLLQAPFPQIIAGLTCAFFASITIAVALGLIGSYVLGVTGGMAFGIMSGLITGIHSIPQDATGVAAALGSAAPGIYIGTAISMGCGLAVSISAQASRFSLPRQIGSVVVGMVIGAIMISVLTMAAFRLAHNFFENILVGEIQPGIGKRVLLGLTLGGIIALAFIIAGRWQVKRWSNSYVAPALASILFGVISGVANNTFIQLTEGRAESVALLGLFAGLGLATWASAMFALPAVIARFLGGRWAGAVAGALSCGMGWVAFYVVRVKETTWWPVVPVSLALVLLGLTVNLWRPWLLYLFQSAWNTILYNLDQKREQQPLSRLHLNAAFWDEFQDLRLYGLDEHLVLVMERNATEGKRAVEYLVNNDQQLWAVNEAQIEFDVHKLLRCHDVLEISAAHHSIFVAANKGLVNELLLEFKQISSDIAVALGQEGNFNKRELLLSVEDQLRNLSQRLGRSHNRYERRFRPLAAEWQALVTSHILMLFQEAEASQEIDSPYISGNPIYPKRGVFVGREDIAQQIEELLRAPNSPPILLYGQRRVGKTSLLVNLSRLLPSRVLPLFLDMQLYANAAQTDAGFLHSIITKVNETAKQLRDFDFPYVSLENLKEDPYLQFNEWINNVGTVETRSIFLLALDELETLNRAFDEGRLNEAALMGMLRHQMQHNHRLKILMACSHTLEEMPRWYTYLVNVQVLKVGYLKEEEARLLIERPVADFQLRYESQATSRILELTRCHPALVQLLCSTIVFLKNRQPPAQRRLATIEDVETAASAALPQWEIVFREMQRELPPQAIKLLRFIAKFGEHTIAIRERLRREFSQDFEDALKILLQRDLIESSGAGYRFQVEFIRRWFTDDARFE